MTLLRPLQLAPSSLLSEMCDPVNLQGCRALTRNTYTIDVVRYNTIRRLLDQRGKPFTPQAAFERELLVRCCRL